MLKLKIVFCVLFVLLVLILAVVYDLLDTLKALTFMRTTLVSSYDTCRRPIPVTEAHRCGPQQTMFNEGECLCCYYDTENIPTIGIGFNLNREDAAQVMAEYNLTLSNVLDDCTRKTTKYCLKDYEAEEIYWLISYYEIAKCVDKYAPSLPLVKRAAIIDVGFAGCATLNKFVKMRDALNRQDWKTAADELRDSVWCEKVGQHRCDRDYSCVLGCTPQTCGTYASGCSENTDCDCFQASNGSGFCADPPVKLCSYLPDCSSCSPLDSVCIIHTCCVEPKCVPLASGDNCPTSPT